MRREFARAALIVLVPTLLGACSRAVEPPARERVVEPAPEPPATLDLPPASPVFAWRCDDGAQRVSRYDPVDRALEFVGPGGRHRLAAVPAASGARWVTGDLSFHNQGDEALYRRGEETARCTVDPVATAEARAAAEGAVFRALGNEPGWSVTVHPDRIVWVGAYGAVRRSFTDVDVSGAAAETVWRGRDETGRLEVRIIREACRDDGDRAFPAQVRVRVDGAAFGGCGRPLDFPF